MKSRLLGFSGGGGDVGQGGIRAPQHQRGDYYGWKNKFGGMDVNEARRLRALEDENRRLKNLVADQAVQISILKEVNSKKW